MKTQLMQIIYKQPFTSFTTHRHKAIIFHTFKNSVGRWQIKTRNNFGMLWDVMKCYEMLWDVMRCYEMFFKVTANISRSNRQGLFNDLSASLGCLKEKEFERLDFILIIVPVSFSFRRKSTCPMSPQYVPSLTSKKRSFTENSHDVFFKHQSSYWQKEVQNLILAKKKSVNMSYLKVQPTNLSILSSYSKNSRKTPISAASMAHLLSGGALAGRLRMTTWRWRGSSPFKGVVLGSP